ncbi:MAG: universal stress protein [Flavobacteriales bacterium]
MSKIIVPTDFTPVSEIALRYASQLAGYIKSEVHLLHIVENEEERAEAESKMKDMLTRMNVSNVGTLTDVGNIFDDIPDMAEREKAELVVMGTHGLRGMQFIVGSNALRVVSEGNVPFIIVQEETKRSANIQKILAPLDLHQETKQKLKIVVDVAQKFGAEVHLVSPKETDEYLHNKLARNVAYAEGYLEERNVKYKTSVTEASSGGFVKDVLKYANYAEIDLICILNSAEDRVIHAFGIDSEQKIITNDAGIPVMILNPSATYKDAASVFAQ